MPSAFPLQNNGKDRISQHLQDPAVMMLMAMTYLIHMAQAMALLLEGLLAVVLLALMLMDLITMMRRKVVVVVVVVELQWKYPCTRQISD